MERKILFKTETPFALVLWGKQIFQAKNIVAIYLLDKLGFEMLPVIQVSFLGENWELNDVAQAFSRKDAVEFLMAKSGKSKPEVLQGIQDFSDKYH